MLLNCICIISLDQVLQYRLTVGQDLSLGLREIYACKSRRSWFHQTGPWESRNSRCHSQRSIGVNLVPLAC
jgi:hypothetical protein